MKKIFLIMIGFIWGGLCACNLSLKNSDGGKENCDRQSISLACWNAQTFFDAEIEGTEYSDYQNLAKWSKDKYLVRLSRLCEIMTSLNADIIVLEEIENAAVVQDIANQLAGGAWDNSKAWSYACFAKENGAAIGCAVFSRFELKDMKLHSMKILSHGEEQPSTRPVIQVTADVNGKNLVIFVNHWKSKSGGQEASEIWRDWQENLLTNRVLELQERSAGENFAVVMCGDFNRDAGEFVCEFEGDFGTEGRNLYTRTGYLPSESAIGTGVGDFDTGDGSSHSEADNPHSGAHHSRTASSSRSSASPSTPTSTSPKSSNTIFRGENGRLLRAYSPWFYDSGSFATEIGSYYYENSWERIDHIFVTGNVMISAFGPKAENPWAGKNSIPNAYRVYSGEGYSDHLPLSAMLTLW